VRWEEWWISRLDVDGEAALLCDRLSGWMEKTHQCHPWEL